MGKCLTGIFWDSFWSAIYCNYIYIWTRFSFFWFLLFCLSWFSFFCFSAFPLFAFPASLLFCFSASAPFYFYFFSLRSFVFASLLLAAPLLLCFFSLLILCFSVSFALFSPVCILLCFRASNSYSFGRSFGTFGFFASFIFWANSKNTLNPKP